MYLANVCLYTAIVQSTGNPPSRVEPCCTVVLVRRPRRWVHSVRLLTDHATHGALEFACVDASEKLKPSTDVALDVGLLLYLQLSCLLEVLHLHLISHSLFVEQVI